MEIGARNRLDGEVVNIKRGAVMCQVRVRIAGGAHMESVMTLDSADEMGLKVGDRVRVAVKAVNVLLLSGKGVRFFFLVARWLRKMNLTPFRSDGRLGGALAQGFAVQSGPEFGVEPRPLPAGFGAALDVLGDRHAGTGPGTQFGRAREQRQQFRGWRFHRRWQKARRLRDGRPAREDMGTHPKDTVRTPSVPVMDEQTGSHRVGSPRRPGSEK